jgi:hypothetical protein
MDTVAAVPAAGIEVVFVVDTEVAMAVRPAVEVVMGN